MSRSQVKAGRLLQIEAMLLAYPEGLSQADIARRLGVNRSTVGRYLPDLPKHIYVDDLDVGKWKIDRQAYLVNLRLTLHEAMAIHLATRLLATRMDRQNPHSAAALRKLGVSLEKLAPLISQHLKLSADLVDGATRREDPRYIQVLEKLTLAWAEGRKVHLWHRHGPSGHVFEYTFAPYFIEPYAVGHTSHVIGLRTPPGAVRTFKIERIERIELITEKFVIPASFDPATFLDTAWGIWYTEEEPQEIVLRFNPMVASRVRESQWHRSQTIVETADGGLIWRAYIAEPKEMFPWIRSWGADVEVLEPETLRDSLITEVQKYERIYLGHGSGTTPIHLLPYAKTERESGRVHRLLYHLIDVGQVALQMWRKVLTDAQQQSFADILGLQKDETGYLLAFLTSLHDLGKASPAFQGKYAPDWLRDDLKAAGLKLHGYSLRTMSAYHGTVSTWTLQDMLPDAIGIDRRFARKIARAIGGHHGIWPLPAELDGIADDTHWQALREDIFWELKSLFDPPSISVVLDVPISNSFLTLFSGFVSVSDWVGSIENYFDFQDKPIHTRRYAQVAAGKAEQALSELGWYGWHPDSDIQPFDKVFPFPPRPIQQAVIDVARDIQLPALVILEAPTGIGKTEAAFYLTDTWLQTHHGRGLYIAMPTQATSNQMFDRTKEFLRKRYPDDLVNIHLVHSQASWSEAMKEIRLYAIGEEDDGQSRVAAMAWFGQQRKRTLLAPFGVGTVDQSLLSVLQTKHFFVRLFGLSHKVLIFDEIHAYDSFMNTIFTRLLSWLRHIGTSVILLSATLPSQTRQQLIRAYTGRSDSPVESVYPALTIADNTETRTIALPKPESYHLAIDWSLSRDAEAIVAYLQQELAGGGCAAVICNTVKRSQEFYRALKECDFISDEDLILFHARFPPIWRQKIEAKVLSSFGKLDADSSDRRPHRAVVVATQVIEQSLDLDFDLMITDLAPLDLLIQRAGRLHRHHRNRRPPLPRRLTVLQPEFQNGLPHFTRADIYEPAILHRTYAVLHNRKAITLPDETGELIEAVYDRDQAIPNLDPHWSAEIDIVYNEMIESQRSAASKASRNLVRCPADEGLLTQSNIGLDEDNPEIHQTFRAQTRDIDPGVTLVCLFQVGDRLYMEPDGSGPAVDLDEEPDFLMTRQLLQRAITIHHWTALQYFLSQDLPVGWRRSGALRYTHPAIFTNGSCDPTGTPFTMTLSQEYGLAIVKEPT